MKGWVSLHRQITDWEWHHAFMFNKLLCYFKTTLRATQIEEKYGTDTRQYLEEMTNYIYINDSDK
jgi:hypothetical protein